MCKEKVVDRKSGKERNCARIVWKEGWCALHHPDTRNQKEHRRQERERKRHNFLKVGAFLWENEPDEFDRIMSRIKENQATE